MSWGQGEGGKGGTVARNSVHYRRYLSISFPLELIPILPGFRLCGLPSPYPYEHSYPLTLCVNPLTLKQQQPPQDCDVSEEINPLLC